jgi:predicted secreted protein
MELAMASRESGTYEAAGDVSAEEVEIGFNDLHLKLSEITGCLEFLGQLAAGEPEQAVRDAQMALQSIWGMMAWLQARCVHRVERSKKRHLG